MPYTLAPSRLREQAVDAFSYLSVLLSIILGLAITQILQGLRGLIQARSRLRAYALTWALLLLVIDVQSWWAMYDLREVARWSFAAFSVVVAQTICLYMIAELVLPDAVGDASINLRGHYWSHYRWLFGFVVLTVLFGIGKISPCMATGHMRAICSTSCRSS